MYLWNNGYPCWPASLNCTKQTRHTWILQEYNPVETDESAQEEEVKESEEEAETNGVTKKPKRTLAERIARMARRLTRRLGRGR